MNFLQILGLILIILANLFLALVVYIKSQLPQIRNFFLFLSLSISAWTITIILSTTTSGRSLILFWYNLAFAGPALVAYLLLQFSLATLKKGAGSRLLLGLLFLPTIFFVFLAAAGGLVTQVSLTPNGQLKEITGYHLRYYLFALYFTSYVIFAFYKIQANYQKTKGINKIILLYLFGGLFISVLAASFTNLILPTLGEARFITIGPFFTLIFLAAFAYTVMKQRLVDLKIFVRRGLIYALLTIAIIFLYISLILIFGKLFHQLAQFTSFPVTLLVVFIIALSFRPLLDLIKRLIDQIFYPERLSYQKALQESSRLLTSLINLRGILNLFITTIPHELKSSSTRIFLYDENKKRFSLKSAGGELRGKLEKTIINLDDPLITYLIKHPEPMDLEILKRQQHRRPHDEELSSVTKTLEQMDASLIVPFITKNKLIAFLVLGPKISGEMFNHEEIALLAALTDEGAVAIENAQLYQEVLDMKNYQEDILKAMSTGIISINLEGIIVTVNHQIEKMLGFSAEEAIGKKLFEIIKEAGIKNMVTEILATGKHYFNFETELEKKSGEKISVSLNTSFLKNSEKKIIGILITIADLTKIKFLEEQIRQAEKLVTMGELVAGVAHEINSPVSTIGCYRDILESALKESGNEIQLKTLEGLRTAVEHLKKVVENFLGFARKTQEVWINTDIKKVIRDALLLTQPNLKVNRVAVEETYEPGLPEIYADHHQLVQVFTNLIVNACHAMPQGGQITLEVNLDQEKEEIEILLSDTGAGIPAEDLPKIFEAFFTTKDITKGTGLGLSVSLGIIQKHRGTIEVQSEVGRGTTFIIRLPVAKKQL